MDSAGLALILHGPWGLPKELMPEKKLFVLSNTMLRFQKT